jgi:hypothetical protein
MWNYVLGAPYFLMSGDTWCLRGHILPAVPVTASPLAFNVANQRSSEEKREVSAKENQPFGDNRHYTRGARTLVVGEI